MKPGEVFGPYRIIRVLANRSLYQEVLGLQRDQFLYSRVRIAPEGGKNKDIGEALLTQQVEFRSRCNHPGLLPVSALGEVDGREYIALEYVSAKTVKEALPFDETTALQILCAMADLLSACAKMDVYPVRLGVEDWIYSRQGEIRLVEAVSPEGAVRGLSFKTLRYQAPEVVEGAPINEASLVYSLGVLVVELLTGVHPFPADSANDLAKLHDEARRGTEPEILAELPDGVRRMVLRFLATEPAKRQNLDGALKALRELKAGGVIGQDAGGAGALALLEEADSQYWHALTLTSEGRYDEALAELRQIVALPIDAIRSMLDRVSQQAEYLYWIVAAERMHASKPSMTLDGLRFCEFLRVELMVHRKCGTLHVARVIERHLLETILVEGGSKVEEQEQRFRAALMLCSDPLVTKQEYARFLHYRNQPEKAYNVQLQLAAAYQQRGMVGLALREVEQVRPKKPDFRYKRLHAQLKRLNMELDMDREALMRKLPHCKNDEARLATVVEFLAKYLRSREGLELAVMYESDGARDSYRGEEYYVRLAVLLYESNDLAGAEQRLLELLRRNPRRNEAITYLADVLRRRNVRLRGTTREEAVAHMLSVIGVA